MDIRRASVEDARAIATVHVRSWQWAYRGQISQEVLDSLSVDDRAVRWRAELAGPRERLRAWVAVENDIVVGFCTAGPSRDAAVEPDIGEIYAIYLDPDLVGTGRGRRLFELAVEDLRQLGYRRAELWVLPTNQRARRFYECAGWRHDGTERMDRVQDLQLPEVRYRVEL